jgi:hypothetical protein
VRKSRQVAVVVVGIAILVGVPFWFVQSRIWHERDVKQAALRTAMRAIRPAQLGRVVARASGDGGGSLGSAPFEEVVVSAKADRAEALSQAVATMRAAGFRLRDRIPRSGTPTLWIARKRGEAVFVVIAVLPKGTIRLGRSLATLGISFVVST